jgi:hypothetical protein
MADWISAARPRSRRASIVVASLALLGLSAIGVGSASADLQSLGPISNATGFPTTATDRNGRSLQLCLDSATLCLSTLPNPDAPASVPENFPDEAFWWSTEATVPMPNGQAAKLMLALEAAFGGTGTVDNGNQNMFGRIRVRADDLTPGATYTFTHPYGVTRAVADDRGRVFDTVDIGCLDSCVERAYSSVTNTNVGPFLRWDNSAPAPPAGYIGDPTVPHRITGSPFATNYFRVQGPGGLDVQTDLFNVSGKLAGPAPAPAPIARLDRTSVDFGSRQINESTGKEIVKMTNVGDANMTFAGGVTLTGADAAHFVLSDNTCTAALAPNAACTVKVALRATTVGEKNATLRFGDNAAGNPHLVALTGSGDPAPDPGPGPDPQPAAVANLSPLSVAFGNQDVNTTSASKQVEVTNTGRAPLTVTAADIAGATPASYAIAANGCATLAPTESCTVSVTFAPASAGSKPGTLRLTHSGLGATDVTLSGTGTVPDTTPAPAPVAAVSPLSLDYGSGTVGTTSIVKYATMSNAGNAPLTLATTLTGINGSDFVIASNTCPAALPAGQQCQVGVAFKPLSAGADKVALLRFTDNSGNVAGSTQDVTLTGNGVAPPPPVAGINVTPNPVTLPDSKVGLVLGLGATATFQTVTVTSNGSAPLNIIDTTLTAGDFTISSNTCEATTRAPGATCQITIRFQAKARGTRTATLRINSNAPGSPLSIPVSGKGI